MPTQKEKRPIGTREAEALTRMAELCGHQMVSYSWVEMLSLYAAAPAMRDALEAEDYFRANGYTKTTCLDFVKGDTGHPLWKAFTDGGMEEVDRHLDHLRRSALMAARGEG